jgi:hypothetical protein
MREILRWYFSDGGSKAIMNLFGVHQLINLGKA